MNKESITMTAQDKEVLALIQEGMTNEEISQVTNLTIGAVKQAVHRLMIKTGHTNRYRLIAAKKKEGSR
jgi:DNA-binding CsgD family transcriptional regulator